MTWNELVLGGFMAGALVAVVIAIYEAWSLGRKPRPPDTSENITEPIRPPPLERPPTQNNPTIDIHRQEDK